MVNSVQTSKGKINVQFHFTCTRFLPSYHASNFLNNLLRKLCVHRCAYRQNEREISDRFLKNTKIRNEEVTYRTGGEHLLAIKHCIKMPCIVKQKSTRTLNCFLKNYKLGYRFDHLDGFDILRT